MKAVQKTFGEKLKEIRISRNMSQEEFARLLNTSKQVISRYELGQTVPKITVVAPWCRILDVSLDDMLNDDLLVLDTRNDGIGDIIHARRKELGYSLESLAQLVGVSKQTVQKWESGKIENLRHSNMFALSKALNVSAEELVMHKKDSLVETQHRDAALKVGANIRCIRESLGMTQQELADRLGYSSRSAINKIELGINELSLSRVFSFAEALNTTPHCLMGLDAPAAETQQDTPTVHEWELLHAYRQRPDAQPFVDKLLDLPARKE